MTNNIDHKNEYIVDLKQLPQEELEMRIESLLTKCRTEVDIKKTAEQGAMFRKGPFQISISLAVKMKKYQDELLHCKRNPYDVLLSVCTDNGWGVPEFRAVDYKPGEGFLFSVVVNDHELVAKARDRRPLLAADLAAANFLRYLGLWVNVKNINFFFDWEPITTEDSDCQIIELGNLNGYLYFMGFNVVKTEETGVENTLTKTLSLRPNLHLQLAKLMYVLLMSRGDKSIWLTDIDFEYFKQIFGELEPDLSYAFHNASWKSNAICPCRNKDTICFSHEVYFLYFMLKDYFYTDKFGPVDISVFEKLEDIKKEIKNSIGEESTQETKPNISEMVNEKLKFLKKENPTSDNKTYFNDIKSLICEEILEKTKLIKKEEENIKHSKGETSSQIKTTTNSEQFDKVSHLIKGTPSSPVDYDRTEIPVNLRENKFDLKSKIFGKVKDEEAVEGEKVDFKVSFDVTTGVSNIKSGIGRWITVDDISPPHTPRPAVTKRPRSISVVTSMRKKKKFK